MESVRASRWSAVVVILLAGIWGLDVHEQGLAATGQDLLLSDGVYSDTQASRGARVYRRICASCHAGELDGSEMGPALSGAEFLGGWDGEVLAELMSLISNTMPAEDPGGLDQGEYTDVLSFILRANGFPPGDELTIDAMAEILIGELG